MKIKRLIQMLLSCFFILCDCLAFASCGWFLNENTLQSAKNGVYYETCLEFFVNPVSTESTGMPIYGSYGESISDTIVLLLESEHFAKLVLDGMESAPPQEIDGFFNPAYAEELKKVQDFTSFSNTNSEDETTTIKTHNMFYAYVSVKEDLAFAQDLVIALQKAAVTFLEANMPLPDGYVATKCYCLSVDYTLTEVVYKA